MNYKIVVDSCCDLLPEQRKDKHFVIVPLTLCVGGVDIIDDDTFDQKDFLKRVSEAPECPKSACPSPERYMQEYENFEGDIYVVTLSAELSGSYNSALVGKQMYEENGGKNNVHVFNSCSASSGEVCVAMEIQRYAEAGESFEQIVEKVTAYSLEKSTLFVLESLEALRKNGRLTKTQYLIANTLNIKPVMRGTQEGTIEKIEQHRGVNRALTHMVAILDEEVKNQPEKIAIISHCNNYERAQFVKQKVEELCQFKEIFITDMAGISSLYGSDGGIIVSA